MPTGPTARLGFGQFFASVWPWKWRTMTTLRMLRQCHLRLRVEKIELGNGGLPIPCPRRWESVRRIGRRLWQKGEWSKEMARTGKELNKKKTTQKFVQWQHSSEFRDFEFLSYTVMHFLSQFLSPCLNNLPHSCSPVPAPCQRPCHLLHAWRYQQWLKDRVVRRATWQIHKRCFYQIRFSSLIKSKFSANVFPFPFGFGPDWRGLEALLSRSPALRRPVCGTCCRRSHVVVMRWLQKQTGHESIPRELWLKQFKDFWHCPTAVWQQTELLLEGVDPRKHLQAAYSLTLILQVWLLCSLCFNNGCFRRSHLPLQDTARSKTSCSML